MRTASNLDKLVRLIHRPLDLNLKGRFAPGVGCRVWGVGTVLDGDSTPTLIEAKTPNPRLRSD
jgi:hypothetical protein